MTCARAVGLLPIGLDTAHLGAPPARQDLDLGADLDLARHGDTRHDRPDAVQAEYALDRHAEDSLGALRLGGEHHTLDLGAQRVHARAGVGRDREHGRVLEERAHDELADVLLGHLDQLGVDHVDLGQSDQAAVDADQLQDRKVLARLRHHAVVGRDDEDHEVDAGGSGDHVADEALVPGYVDQPHEPPVGELERGEAQVDRHAALALFLEPIRVDARERAHERRLAVVDVSGGSNDNGADLHGAPC